MKLNDETWHDYIERLYAHFREDFILNATGEFAGLQIGLVSRTLTEGKEETFWHLISKEGRSRPRVRDPQRCERIRWPRHILGLAQAGSSGVVSWNKLHRQESRMLVALADFSYIVVPVERGRYALLLTAFSVDRTHERRKLRKQWQRSRKS